MVPHVIERFVVHHHWSETVHDDAMLFTLTLVQSTLTHTNPDQWLMDFKKSSLQWSKSHLLNIEVTICTFISRLRAITVSPSPSYPNPKSERISLCFIFAPLAGISSPRSPLPLTGWSQFSHFPQLGDVFPDVRMARNCGRVQCCY